MNDVIGKKLIALIFNKNFTDAAVAHKDAGKD